MNIRIQAIHFDATDQLEAFIQKKVAKLEQYFDGIISAEVSLKVVKPESAKNKEAAIRLIIKNGDCFAEKVNDTFEESIDECVEAFLQSIWKMESHGLRFRRRKIQMYVKKYFRHLHRIISRC